MTIHGRSASKKPVRARFMALPVCIGNGSAVFSGVSCGEL
jgi:hypothetical protein